MVVLWIARIAASASVVTEPASTISRSFSAGTDVKPLSWTTVSISFRSERVIFGRLRISGSVSFPSRRSERTGLPRSPTRGSTPSAGMTPFFSRRTCV